MSIKVTVSELAERVEEYGNAAFVVTSGENGKVKTIHVPVLIQNNLIFCTPGKGTLANIKESGPVTLIFPSPVSGGPSMIIDGIASISDLKNKTLSIKIDAGVLHRPSPAALGENFQC
tara:strand:- start:425 stop:778 length:354 start_codon:yes stop_codon:yes gene_type:complete